MRGFLKRDFYLTSPYYGVTAGILLLVFHFVPRMGPLDYTVFFLLVYSISELRSLSAYDEGNGWLAYAAAVSGGRGKLVDARYLFAFLEGLILTGVIFLFAMTRRESLTLWAAGFYGSAFFLTVSATLPICYRCGTKKGRMVSLILSFLLLGVLGGLSTGILDSARADLARGALRTDVRGFFSAAALALPLLGVGALALSWQLSRHIMEKKEF